jgi:hypothetical protein
VLRAVFPYAPGHEPAPLVSIVVKLDNGDRLTDDERVAREFEAVLEGAVEGPYLLIFSVGVSSDFLDQRVQFAFCSGITSFHEDLAK